MTPSLQQGSILRPPLKDRSEAIDDLSADGNGGMFNLLLSMGPLGLFSSGNNPAEDHSRESHQNALKGLVATKSRNQFLSRLT
jgi:hypothetical protein